MRSSTVIASVLAFAASALAQDATPGYAVVSAPGQGEIVPAGKTFTIKWSAGKFSGPATISLLAGATPQTLQVTDAIANDVEVKTGSFSWKVDCSLGEDKTYGLKIADQASGGATFQYSFPFEIKGPSCDSTTSTSSVSASASETGYVAISLSATTSGYPTTSITASTSASAYPTKGSNSTTSATVSYTTSSYSNSTMTTVKSSTKATSTASTLTTYSTPVVIVTETSAATGSASSTPATSTTASSPVPTAGAARAGAGLALGLIAAALAL